MEYNRTTEKDCFELDLRYKLVICDCTLKTYRTEGGFLRMLLLGCLASEGGRGIPGASPPSSSSLCPGPKEGKGMSSS